ncbi:MAG: hypothetical protein ABSA93_17170 [Streptosporangiaceae bacterium]|jgi:hypothetical protein
MSGSGGNPDVMWSVGEGPTITVSVSLHRGTVEWIRERTGKREFSAYVEEALERKIAFEKLDELIKDYTDEHGEFTEQELAAARASLYGTAGPAEGSVA